MATPSNPLQTSDADFSNAADGVLSPPDPAELAVENTPAPTPTPAPTLPASQVQPAAQVQRDPKQVIRDPKFLALAPADQDSVLSTIDPKYSALSPQDRQSVLANLPRSAAASDNPFDKPANENQTATSAPTPAAQPSVVSRVINKGVDLVNKNIVQPIKEMAKPPQTGPEHVINLVGGQPALDVWRLAQGVVNTGKEMLTAGADAFPQTTKDFNDALMAYRNGQYRDAAISGAESATDLLPAVGAPSPRKTLEGLREGGDLATPLTGDAFNAGMIALGDEAPEIADYSPRSAGFDGRIEGASRPANVLQGPINKSLGATAGDVRYADPAQALIDENITAVRTVDRQVAVKEAINKLKPQLDAKLDAAPRVNVDAAVGKTFRDGMDKIENSAMTEPEKNAALEELSVAEKRITKTIDKNGTISAREANDAKRSIGERAGGWRDSPVKPSSVVQDIYLKLYGDLKIPSAAEESRRMSNLIAADKALAVKADANKVATGSVGSKWYDAGAKAVGHVGPAIIKGGQDAADVAHAVIPPAVVIGSQPQESKPSVNPAAKPPSSFDPNDPFGVGGQSEQTPPEPEPSNEPVSAAIARAEGAQVPGSIPNRSNNPGDLALGDRGNGTVRSVGQGAANITVFPTTKDGWNALNQDIKRKLERSPDMTWYELGRMYAPGAQAKQWAENAARIARVNPNDRVASTYNRKEVAQNQ